jgi:hypothetical protein
MNKLNVAAAVLVAALPLLLSAAEPLTDHIITIIHYLLIVV